MRNGLSLTVATGLAVLCCLSGAFLWWVSSLPKRPCRCCVLRWTSLSFHTLPVRCSLSTLADLPSVPPKSVPCVSAPRPCLPAFFFPLLFHAALPASSFLSPTPARCTIRYVVLPSLVRNISRSPNRDSGNGVSRARCSGTQRDAHHPLVVLARLPVARAADDEPEVCRPAAAATLPTTSDQT